jgi:hypothetical protein
MQLWYVVQVASPEIQTCYQVSELLIDPSVESALPSTTPLERNSGESPRLPSSSYPIYYNP